SNCRNFQNWLRRRLPRLIAHILAERPFNPPLVRQYFSFDNNFRRGRNFKIDRFAPHERDRRALQCTRDVDLIDVRRQHHAAHQRYDGLPTNRHRDRHWLIHRFVLLINLADMLLRREQTAQRVSIVYHQTVHAPIYPSTLRVLVMTVCHVPIYRPPSPPWIRGMGNLSTSTASPRSMFSLHGPLFTRVGAMSFSLRFK